jgi:hypothetical protein
MPNESSIIAARIHRSAPGVIEQLRLTVRLKSDSDAAVCTPVSIKTRRNE